MDPPFTVEQFLEVFRRYNEAIWPLQIVLYGLGVGVVAAARFAPQSRARVLVPVGLALLWAWTGGVYHLGFFSGTNPAAHGFGLAFLAQAAVWVAWAWRAPELRFRIADTLALAIGNAILAYAFVIYPMFNVLLGHRYPAMPTFGAPCPTTLASLGLLAWAAPRPPWWVWLIPVLWALVGTSAALTLGIYEDLGLLAAALLALVAVYRK